MADEEKDDNVFGYVNDLFSTVRYSRDFRTEYFSNNSSYWRATVRKYGKTRWSLGDIVGCAVDLKDDGKSAVIEYYLNGVSQGIAFDIEYEGNLYPAMAMSKEQSVTFIFKESEFNHNMPKGYEPLNIVWPMTREKHVWTFNDEWSQCGMVIGTKYSEGGQNIFCNKNYKGWQAGRLFLHAAKLEKGKKYYYEIELKHDNVQSIGFADSAWGKNINYGRVGSDEHSWACQLSMLEKWGLDGPNCMSIVKMSELQNIFDKNDRDIVIEHLCAAGYKIDKEGFELKDYAQLQKYHDQMQRKRIEESAQVKRAKAMSQNGGYPVLKNRLEPIARVILCGVYDENHSLSKFGGMRYIIKAIWEYTMQFNVHIWSKYVKMKEPLKSHFNDPSKTYMCKLGVVQFPKPSGININMMPFFMSQHFCDTKLPFFLKEYHVQVIQKCLGHNSSLDGTICYLTIDESIVQKGNTQRRPAMHTDHLGILKDPTVGGGKANIVTVQAGWGGGSARHNSLIDGIFMASKVGGPSGANSTCAIWNCSVDKYFDDTEVIGKLGDCQHLKRFIETKAKKTETRRGRLYWITDRTPHCSLPMQETGHRQFFRLVSSKISTWYKQHNTANIYGLLPDQTQTQIVDINKFE